MNVSRRWLEAFLRRPLDARDAAGRLAMLGAPVDAIEALHADLGGIVVALVEEVRPHPHADKLRLCVVNDGGAERRQVVCGAPNVTAGRRYPFAPVGSRVPHGRDGQPMAIVRAKLRGELSEGMLCSARELGLGQDAAGLWELDTDAAPGTALIDAVPIADERLIVDVTPNRPDLLCHKGIARELGAAYGVPFRLPEIPGAGSIDVPPARRLAAGKTATTVAGVRVAIDDVEGCPRLLGAVVRGVTVGPSPEWLRRRLESVGARSINNVVDATNCILLELNHPMHAYDLACLRGGAVVARRGRSGERLTTLDGVERGVTDQMTVIADGDGAIGIAGVMGGADSEVHADTRDLFLECAVFDPSRIRRTGRALGLSTDASYRFERGIDRWGGADALRRCIELVLAIAGGTLAEPPVDLWPQPTHPPRIFLRLERVARLLGVALPLHAVEKALVAISATVVAKPEDGRIAVDVPGWRPDLVAEIDLIEEVARVHGYDQFPSELRPYRVGTLPDAPLHGAMRDVREGLVALGLLEASTLPLGPAVGPGSVALQNPLSAEEGYLRQRLLPGLVRQVERNWAVRTGDVRLFEIGTVFAAGAPGARPIERTHVAAVVTGLRAPAHWSDTHSAAFDVWDIKALAERVAALAIPGATIQVAASALELCTADGTVVGSAGPLAADAPPWSTPLFGLEMVLDPGSRLPAPFRLLPATPSSERVLALLLPEGTRVGQVESVVRAAGAPLLESVDVTSDYRGADLPAGARSVAFRLSFRAPARTLEAAEVDAAERRVLAALHERLGIERRGAPLDTAPAAGPTTAGGD